jgi:delta1-piperideine-2-carboxylate reductase
VLRLIAPADLLAKRLILEANHYSAAALTELCANVLVRHGLSERHALSAAKALVAAERDGAALHGVSRLKACLDTAHSAGFNRCATPRVVDLSSAVSSVDADFGFCTHAFETGLPRLIETAKLHGLGALVIRNCFHFSVLWPEVEAIAAHGLVSLATTPSHRWVAPAGGARPVFGTNPIAFAWPRETGVPFVFDFATSAIARMDLDAHVRGGTLLPPDCAVDENGRATRDPNEALRGAMLTFGGYKGSALAAMVELLAGSLIGDRTSAQSSQYDAGAGLIPLHGELILAFDPRTFGSGGPEDCARSSEALFRSIEEQGARLPSQKRYDARRKSDANGIYVDPGVYSELSSL